MAFRNPDERFGRDDIITDMIKSFPLQSWLMLTTLFSIVIPTIGESEFKNITSTISLLTDKRDLSPTSSSHDQTYLHVIQNGINQYNAKGYTASFTIRGTKSTTQPPRKPQDNFKGPVGSVGLSNEKRQYYFRLPATADTSPNKQNNMSGNKRFGGRRAQSIVGAYLLPIYHNHPDSFNEGEASDPTLSPTPAKIFSTNSSEIDSAALATRDELIEEGEEESTTYVRVRYKNSRSTRVSETLRRNAP